ncbi:MAG TPA: hypothetical protein VIM34_11645 [Burkholderiaceae bacterium]
MLKPNPGALGVPGAHLDFMHMRQPLAADVLEGAGARHAGIGEHLRFALHLALGLLSHSGVAWVGVGRNQLAGFVAPDARST